MQLKRGVGVEKVSKQKNPPRVALHVALHPHTCCKFQLQSCHDCHLISQYDGTLVLC